jgi:hypothetical protein
MDDDGRGYRPQHTPIAGQVKGVYGGAHDVGTRKGGRGAAVGRAGLRDGAGHRGRSGLRLPCAELRLRAAASVRTGLGGAGRRGARGRRPSHRPDRPQRRRRIRAQRVDGRHCRAQGPGRRAHGGGRRRGQASASGGGGCRKRGQAPALRCGAGPRFRGGESAIRIPQSTIDHPRNVCAGEEHDLPERRTGIRGGRRGLRYLPGGQRGRLQRLSGLPAGVRRGVRATGQPRDRRGRRGPGAVPHPRAADRHDQGRDRADGAVAGRGLLADAQLLRSLARRAGLRAVRRVPAEAGRLRRRRVGRPGAAARGAAIRAAAFDGGCGVSRGRWRPGRPG